MDRRQRCSRLWAWSDRSRCCSRRGSASAACMAATLYEPAFAIVGRAVPEPAARLRALALVTRVRGRRQHRVPPADRRPGAARLDGGRRSGCSRRFLRCRQRSPVWPSSRRFGRAPLSRRIPPPWAPALAVGPVFWWTLATFAFASLASAGLTANLVPALGERQVSPSAAALLGGMFGVMQLPGRLLLSTGGAAGSPMRLIVVSLLLQAVGLLAFSAAPSVVVTAGGLVIFAGGAGLATLGRPHFMQTHFGPARLRSPQRTRRSMAANRALGRTNCGGGARRLGRLSTHGRHPRVELRTARLGCVPAVRHQGRHPVPSGGGTPCSVSASCDENSPGRVTKAAPSPWKLD